MHGLAYLLSLGEPRPAPAEGGPMHKTRIPWNLSFRYTHCAGQFTPKMKANVEPCLLSSLVWIDSGIMVSQHHLESFFLWNEMWRNDNFHGIHDKLRRYHDVCYLQYENLFARENSNWTRATPSFNMNFLVQINFHIALKPCRNCIILYG